MADCRVIDVEQLENDLTVVADAIREKGGTSEPLAFPNGMVDAVKAIANSSGGSGGISATKVVDVDVNIDASTTTAVSYVVDDLEFISSVENPTKYNAFANNDAFIAFVTPKDIIGEPSGTDVYNRSMIVMNGNTNYTPTLTNLVSMGALNVSNQNYGVYALKLNCKDIANGKPKGNMSFSVRHHTNGTYEVLAGTYNIQVYYLTDWIWGF